MRIKNMINKNLLIFVPFLAILNFLIIIFIQNIMGSKKYFVSYSFKKDGYTMLSWSIVNSEESLNNYDMIFLIEDKIQKELKADTLKINNFIKL